MSTIIIIILALATIEIWGPLLVLFLIVCAITSLFSSTEKSSAKKTTTTKNSSYKTVSYTRKPTKEEIKRERNKMTAKVRERILARDNYTCQICGLSRKDEPHLALHVDHIVPVSKGGKTIDNNLQCLCWQCNLKKSDKTY
jgi:5-methylcytosine-specific restriction endonuclease McrA